ncbi:hypothetical protein FZ103_10635 [Streptomonospora sp. PA3]|uniref:hypothetical protein n=1 Tax=Streptomonospora sp. PA3 TaxID=2607326 RepID=UPI0012DF8CEF|nr:hypothetical protein [Streptomonospora sp. PA3]MUL41627.1 hypothetical protein [Streptomonospora sp. PA3]
MRIADADTRARIIADLRALADDLDARPAVPVPEIAELAVTYFPSGTDSEQIVEVDRAAELLGTVARWWGEHYVAELRIGAAAYRAVAIPDLHKRRHEALMSYRDNVIP